MEKLPPFGTDVRGVIGPTMATFGPLLLANTDEIRSVPKQTFSYGQHERQQLDVYSPPKPDSRNDRHPVLMFLYGGGFTQGGRTLAGFADGLCHANIASFFALRHGYTTIVVDYRLVNTHGAKFPSGGEDLSLAVAWVKKHASELSKEPLDLFIMGNSAGGVHLTTYLLHPSFSASRKEAVSGTNVRFRGAIILSVPLHFHYAHPSRKEVNDVYFCDIAGNAPLGLLKTARENGTIDFLVPGFQIHILVGEYDKADEILKTRDDFVQEWLLIDDSRSSLALSTGTMLGHNHISPFCTLGTNVDNAEAWGHQVASFCDATRAQKVL